MADYYLKGIDDELWKRVTAKAGRKGQTVKFVILRFLNRYAPAEAPATSRDLAKEHKP